MHLRGPGAVFIVSAAVGFAIGAFARPMWTDNVESAQVLAGLVHYPSPTPMSEYHTSAYSLTIQAAALLLRAGITEWPLSVLSSGAQAALAFGALSLLTLAVSRSATTALLAPVLFLRLAQWCEGETSYLHVLHGHRYPNIFPNHTGIYGIVGLYAFMLILALLALRRARTGAFLLGLMPGVHPGLALPCALAAAALFLSLGRERTAFARRGWRPAALGLAVSVAGGLVQWAFFWPAPPASPPSPERVHEVMEAFLRSWEDHNFLLPTGERLAFFESEFYTLSLGMALLTVHRRWLARPVRAMLCGLLTVTAVAIAYTLVLNWRPEIVPIALRNILIMRWLNLSSLAFPVLGLGLAGRLAFRRRQPLAALVLAAAFAAIATGGTRSLTAASGPGASEGTIFDARGFLLPAAALVSVLLLPFLERRRRAPRLPRAVVRALSTAALGVAAAYIAIAHFGAASSDRRRGLDESAAVLAAARDRAGFLLPCEGLWSLGRVQLRTRRPLLLDPTQLNMLTKIPSSAPRMAEILERVYGIDVVHDAPGDTPDVWSPRRREEWQAIAREFGVTDVLVWSGVTLDLPVVLAGPKLTLYTIPTEPAASR